MSWSPILEGAARDEALAAVDRIGEALRDHEPELLGVAGGAAGAALFFAHRGVARGDHDDWDRAWTLLDRAIAGLAEIDLPPALYGGFSGIAWSLAHVASLGEEDPEDDSEVGEFEEVDAILLELLEVDRWPGDYDLINGLAGLMLYGLIRLPDPAGAAICDRLVELAERASESSDGAVCWRTPVERLPPWQAERAPEGYFNAGLAHGVPGMIAGLAQIAAAGRGGDRARSLCAGAAAWIDRVARDSRAPSWIPVGGEPSPSRLAWCYGDPGIAGALGCAARALGDPALDQQALAIARRAAAVPLEDTGVNDPGLCHGAVGIGHIFNRLWQTSGDPVLRDAARRCYQRGLELLEPGALFGGVGRYDPQLGHQVASPGFLEGAAGVGLGLLAAAGDHEPSWDQLLMLSPR